MEITVNEKINSMRDKELLHVFEMAKNQIPAEHASLYGVTFEVWVELLYSECSKRKLIGGRV